MEEEEEQLQEKEGGADMRQVVEQVLGAKGVNVRGGLLFAMTAGSMAFNLNVAGSDCDYFAVYAADVESAFALSRPQATVDSHEPDLQMYEAAKYCELLLKGNPKVVEPLFAEHLVWQSEEWRELKKLRHHLMTQALFFPTFRGRGRSDMLLVTVDQYVSYALSQVGDYLKGKGAKPPAKKFYHAVRLMQEARRIITHGAPRVWYDEDDPDRAFLMSIRRGEKDLDALMVQLQESRGEINELKAKLPARTDPCVLGEWLLYLRRKHAVGVRGRGLTRDVLSATEGSSIPLHNRALDLLRQFGVEGQILSCIPSGSRAHGLAVPTSSEDFVAVYAAPTRTIAGLTPPPMRVDELGPDSKQRETYARGMLVFEAGYACQLLAQGNHRLVEALFCPFSSEDADASPRYETLAWRELREKAGAGLVGVPMLNHYVGVAQGQLQTRPLTRAHLYHALRLLAEAQHIADHHGPPRVTLPADQVDFLLRVRQGSDSATPTDDANKAEGEEEDSPLSVPQLLQRAKAQAAALVERKGAGLPPRVDRTPLDDWLSGLRLALLFDEESA